MDWLQEVGQALPPRCRQRHQAVLKKASSRLWDFVVRHSPAPLLQTRGGNASC